MRDMEKLKEKNKEYIWHPFTQMKEYLAGDPLIIEEGQGRKLKDINGRWYYDGFSSIWVNIHGHRVPELDKALLDQVGKIAQSTLLGMANIPSVELAEKLIQRAPRGLKKVFYSEDGSEAVEIAIKMAFQYWQLKGRTKKKSFVTMNNAYHGDTIGSVSVGAMEIFHEAFRPLLFPTYRVNFPDVFRFGDGKDPEGCKQACLLQLEELFREKAEEIGALIVEPLVQGSAGMIMMPEGYLKAVRELCTRYEVLLIADEVATGFGRTGRMFACDQEGVSPDLMTIGKGLTGGYLPLAATLTTEEIFNAFLGDYEEQKTFYHGHSYTGNPLACAVALANLELLNEKFFAELQGKIDFAAERLKDFWNLPGVGDVRQRGLMVGIELVAREGEKVDPWADRKGYRVTQRCRELGLITRPLGNVVVFIPPLGSTLEELGEMLDIIKQAIELEMELS